MKLASLKLANLLIGKAVIETLLVGVIAVGSYLNSFPPTFHGWGEPIPETRSIAGWAVNSAVPRDRVEVQLFIDNKFVASQIAERSRPDVHAAGWAADDLHGYSFQIQSLSPGRHEARVYAMHGTGDGARYTLQLLGDPIGFEVEQSGEWKSQSKK